MRRLRTSAFALAVALAGISLLPAATFKPVSGASPADLIAGDERAGSVALRSDGVVRRVMDGRADQVLSVTLDVKNRTGRDLVLKPLDIWAVTEGGTVLSLPELRLDGLAVPAAHIPAGRTGRLVALFRLGPVEAFSGFTLHWAGRAGGETVRGEAAFASEDGGYMPPAGGEVAEGDLPPEDAGQRAYGQDTVFVDPYPCDDYSWYGCYGYPYGYPPYYAYRPYFYFGLGYYYPYYPYYPYRRVIVGGRGDRQDKEDEILRRTGRSPDGGSAFPRGRSDGGASQASSPPPARGSGRSGIGSRGGSSRPPSSGRSGGGIRSSGGRSGGAMRSGGASRSGGGRSGGGGRPTGGGAGRGRR